MKYINIILLLSVLIAIAVSTSGCSATKEFIIDTEEDVEKIIKDRSVTYRGIKAKPTGGALVFSKPINEKWQSYLRVKRDKVFFGFKKEF